MTPEELFESHKYLVEITLRKVYKNPRLLAKKYRIEVEDLTQYCFTGLWRAAITWDESKSKFTTHAINHIKWHLNERISRECNIMKMSCNRTYDENEIYKIVTLDKDYHMDDYTFTWHDIISNDDVNVEEDALGGNFLDNIMKLLNDRERKMVKLRMAEKTNVEIGEMFGMTGSNVQVIIRGVREKLSRYLKLKEVV